MRVTNKFTASDKLFEAIQHHIPDGESYLELVLKSIDVKLEAAGKVVPERGIAEPRAEPLAQKEKGGSEL